MQAAIGVPMMAGGPSTSARIALPSGENVVRTCADTAGPSLQLAAALDASLSACCADPRSKAPSAAGADDGAGSAADEGAGASGRAVAFVFWAGEFAVAFPPAHAPRSPSVNPKKEPRNA